MDEEDGFLGIGTPKSVSGAQSNLNNVFNFALPTAKAATGGSLEDTSAASGYFKSLLSGNRAATMQANAPAANAVQSQADAAKRQQASLGTARGGGTGGTGQQINDSTMAQIDNALFGTRAGAATGLNATAGTEGAIGASLAGTGTNAAAASGDIGLNQEKLSQSGIFQQLLGDTLGFGLFKALSPAPAAPSPSTPVS